MQLNLSSEYTREDIHGIFSPDTTFTPQAGTWGLQGAVQVPDRENDFVFFVTFGHKEGDHQFEESLTDDGILTWQSQPKQKLNERRVLKWINHDEIVSNIYLFLRTDKNDPYQYLGKIKYLTHDTSREQPVHFKWQLLDWDYVIPSQNLEEKIVATTANEPQQEGLIPSETPPSKVNGSEEKKPSFNTRTKPDYAAQDVLNRELGLAGELLVLEYEKQRLIDAGRKDLADKVIHTSVVEGDGAGYDIRSYCAESGDVLYIEVKTTRGKKSSPFFMSENEKCFAETHKGSYQLLRVYEFNKECNSGSFYCVNEQKLEELQFRPTQYRVSF